MEPTYKLSPNQEDEIDQNVITSFQITNYLHNIPMASSVSPTCSQLQARVPNSISKRSTCQIKPHDSLRLDDGRFTFLSSASLALKQSNKNPTNRAVNRSKQNQTQARIKPWSPRRVGRLKQEEEKKKETWNQSLNPPNRLGKLLKDIKASNKQNWKTIYWVKKTKAELKPNSDSQPRNGSAFMVKDINCRM